MLLRHWKLTIGYVLFAFRYDRLISFTSLLDGAVTALALVVFTHLFGAEGAALGLIAGVCLVSLPVFLTALARTGVLTAGAVLRSLVPWFWRFALVAAGSVLLARAVPQRSPLALVAVASAVVIVYLALMLPVALSEPLGEYVRPRLAALAERIGRRRTVRAT